MSDLMRDKDSIIRMLKKQVDGLKEENRKLKFNARLLFWALSAASFALIYMAYQ